MSQDRFFESGQAEPTQEEIDNWSLGIELGRITLPSEEEQTELDRQLAMWLSWG